MRHTFTIFVLAFLLAIPKLSEANTGASETIESILTQIDELQFPPLRLAYKDNLQAISSTSRIIKQEQALRLILNQLSTLETKELSQKLKLDIDLIRYEVDLNLERLALERQWNQSTPTQLNDDGLARIPMGKAWYSYFLKRWVDADATPESVMSFGQKEVERVYSKLQAAQTRVINELKLGSSGLDGGQFFLNSKQSVHSAFEEEKKHIQSLASACFPYLDQIPEIKIRAGTNARLAQTPGYYGNNRFSYNYFDKPFNIRQIAWLYMHEAVPGHHYQLSLESQLPKSQAQKQFTYSSYREGWAAYIEELGTECGFYDQAHDELGKWEWDMIRSVRIVLDVGLNYYAWDDAKALSYWQQYIKGQDDIAMREIARMKRWPAQVITYKYGADALLKLKQRAKVSTKQALKTHHAKLLTLGPMPFSLLEKYF